MDPAPDNGLLPITLENFFMVPSRNPHLRSGGVPRVIPSSRGSSAWGPSWWVLMVLMKTLTAGAAVDYVAEIKPVLRERCYACHGALKQKAKLRLDTVAGMRSGGESGPAIRAGDAGSSRLVQRVETRDAADRMPPEHEGEVLSADQIARLRSWIDAGADGPADEVPESDPKEHWAFRPPVRPSVPQVSRPEWVRNPIDAFVARAHDQHGLTPRREASRQLLVRRVHVDLIGVPPTAEEWAALDHDTGPGWYERLVDRLLDDPRHGERWARHWMDIWRYSDWWGLGDQLRNSQRHIWRWRDWMVESLNTDTPYDEMVRLMLAADELHPNDPEKLRATGYLARNYFLFNRNQWMDEVVEHVGKGFLGLTLNCSKCHDHKYDPIPQADYYRMRAFFEPYHVRLDMVPGESDLNRDGMPRAFDGQGETPTYRFVRGLETQPDKSAVMTPGIPNILAFREPAIQPVSLPAEAWQPERRPWVFEAYRASARARVESAEKAATEARAKRAETLGRRGESAAMAEAEVALGVAEQELALARAESASLEHRMAATRASWRVTDGAGASPEIRADAVDRERNLERQAVRAEQEAAVARARHGLAAAQLRLWKAAEDKKSAMRAECDKAREALDKAVAVASAALPLDGMKSTRLAGAAWTPTRFLDSTKDDPRVELGPTSTGRRKALAAWITDARHPLTARVGVNHLWNRHLGVPLVTTVFDFGRKGAMPTHPELLDWLACEWVESGWSMKHLHRLIVTSATYRMDSRVEEGDANVAKDPDNRYLWRRQPIRLEAQVVRDAILAQSGELDLTRGGPSVLLSEQAESKRRSLYFFHSNNERNLFLTTFDDATVKECYRREQSIVPQQALALSNSRLVHDAAGRIVMRLERSLSGKTAGAAVEDTAFVRQAFRVLLGFEPGAEELTASLRALGAWRSLPKSPDDATAGVAGEPRAGLVWALLNHNDFVTLR